MKVRLLTKTAEHVVVETTLTSDEVEKHTANAYMVLAMRNELKPEMGKTSREVVAEQLDPKQVADFVSSMAVDTTWQLAADKMKLAIAGMPACSFEVPYEQGKDFKYIIDGVRIPCLTLSSYEPVILAKGTVEVSDEDIDAYIERETARFAVSAPDTQANKRGNRVAADSFISIGMETSKNGVPYPPFTFDARDYELGVGDMPDGFDEHIIGLGIGESVSFEFEGPDMANEHKGVVMPAKFETTVTVNGMLKRVPPTIDDAWVAEHVKECTTVEMMRRRVYDEIMNSKSDEEVQFCRYLAAVQVADRLVEPIPDEVLQTEYALAAQNFQRAMQSQGMTADQYYKKQGVSAQEFASDLRLQTREQLRQQLALDAVARHEGIELTDTDLTSYYKLINPDDPADVAKQVAEAGQETITRRAALRMKTNAWLVENAVEPEDTEEE